MKKNTLKKLLLKSTLTLGALAAVATQAQTFYTPAYRGQAETESAYWDSFTNAYGGANDATTTAPGGSLLAGAAITQTTPGAFLAGSDIYSFSSTNTFVLNYSVLDAGNFPDGIGNVVFQAYSEGNPLDYDSVVLSYQIGSETYTLSPDALITSSSGNPMGGNNIISSWSWNLQLDNSLTGFAIDFNGSDVSVALHGAMLDVAGFNVVPVPEPGSLALMGIAGMSLISFRFLRRQPLP